jgi:hypothetical protein
MKGINSEFQKRVAVKDLIWIDQQKQGGLASSRATVVSKLIKQSRGE